LVVRLGNEPTTYKTTLGLEFMLGVLSDLRHGQLGTQNAALRHAWEMKRLAEEFPARGMTALPPGSWQMLETMLRDHAAAVRRELDGRRLQRSDEPASRPSNAGWRASTKILFESLTDGGNGPESSVNAIDRLLDEIVNSVTAESNLHR
jgi:hypothetical protein